jgi:hypothetical protein
MRKPGWNAGVADAANVGSKIVQQPVEVSVAVETKPTWSLLLIITGVAASLAWTGFLGWAVGKALGAW